MPDSFRARSAVRALVSIVAVMTGPSSVRRQGVVPCVSRAAACSCGAVRVVMTPASVPVSGRAAAGRRWAGSAGDVGEQLRRGRAGTRAAPPSPAAAAAGGSSVPAARMPLTVR